MDNNNMLNMANELISSSKKLNPSSIMVPSQVVDAVPAEAPKKKRGRPKKNAEEDASLTGEIMATSVATNQNNLPLCQTNEPYSDTYTETMNLLRGSVAQIDNLNFAVTGEIDTIRKSKTMKGKYTYLSNLCAASSSLISSKIGAIREMNGIISKCHDLEQKRFKENQALNLQNKESDDKYIADLYNAYINTPVNANSNPLLAVNAGNTINNIPMMMGGIPVGMDPGMTEEQGYQNYLNNVTPEQNRMLLDGNPNIETVVVYDPNTGDKMFDVIDITTGIPVSNYPRPDRLLLDDTTIDFASGIASNSNIGQNWKVVVIGDVLNQF